MKSTLIFNDISSADLGLVIQAPPTYEFPERDMSSSHIVGRNGDSVIDNKCYKNVSRSYSLGMKNAKNTTHVTNASAVLEWLTSADGKYVRLEDSYDPDVYRMARFYSSGSFTNYYDQALAISVSFECKPQRFLKSGENATKTVGAVACATNPSHYESLPLIRVDGIPNSISEVMMMSVFNSNNEVVSNVTMSDIENKVVCIDSEEQNCYDDQGDINEKIGLNGHDFPRLEKDKTTIKIEKFKMEFESIDAYNNLITHSQQSCKSQHQEYSDIESLKQDTILIKSYSSLIDSNKKKYSAASYQSYISGVCDNGYTNPFADSYTFTSFNTLLSTYGQQYSVSGDLSQLSLPDWLDYIQDGTNITLKAKVAGFFITSNDKVVTYFAAGQTIGTTTNNKTTTITYYEANDDKTLRITYTDKPDWVNVTIGYAGSSNNPTLSDLTFSTAAVGYYWTDKSWTFGSAQWNYRTSETALNTLRWSTSKKAFMSTTGISTSTTTSYTYKYFASVIQYEDTDDKPLLFTTQLVGTSLNTIQIFAKTAGYYSVAVGGGDTSKWVYYNEGNQIQTSGTTLTGKTAFDVYYIAEPPTYSEDSSWEDGDGERKDWLDPTPVNDGLNATTTSFKVLKTSKYRWSYTDSEGNEKYTDWSDYEANSTLSISKAVGDTFTICKLDTIPNEYAFDRCYTDTSVSNGETSENPPTFLSVTHYKDKDMKEVMTAEEYREMKDKDRENCMMKYTAALAGYYKWGTNTAWLYKDPATTADMTLLSSGYKDEALFYFMPSLPTYADTYDSETNSPRLDLYTITPHQDATTGNPDEVNFVIKTAGYYRVNADSNWTWYDSGDALTTAVVGKTTVIYHLQNTNADLSSLSITITPRWWKL